MVGGKCMHFRLIVRGAALAMLLVWFHLDLPAAAAAVVGANGDTLIADATGIDHLIHDPAIGFIGSDTVRGTKGFAEWTRARVDGAEVGLFTSFGTDCKTGCVLDTTSFPTEYFAVVDVSTAWFPFGK